MCFFDRLAFDTAESQNLRDTAVFEQRAILSENLDGLVRLDGAGMDATGDDTAQERIGFEDGADHAERTFGDLRSRYVLEHQIEQRCQTFILRAFRVERHPAVASGTVEDREVELFVGGVEIGEEVEDFVDHFLVTTIRTVDLVDGDNRLEADLESLADHELCLRHRTFGGVNQNDGAIHHRQDALDFTAEIGVAGRIDDIDAGVLPDNRGRLGENGDPAFLFNITGVHHAFCNALVVAGLLQEFIDQCGFAMIDVCDNSDITQFHMEITSI